MPVKEPELDRSYVRSFVRSFVRPARLNWKPSSCCPRYLTRCGPFDRRPNMQIWSSEKGSKVKGSLSKRATVLFLSFRTKKNQALVICNFAFSRCVTGRDWHYFSTGCKTNFSVPVNVKRRLKFRRERHELLVQGIPTHSKSFPRVEGEEGPTESSRGEASRPTDPSTYVRTTVTRNFHASW